MRNPNCYTLIHALTGAEKRAFTVYARRHVIGAGNQYLALFEILESMQEYDADKLMSDMRAAGLPVKWYKADMQYLYDILLDHLRHMHRDKSVHMQLLSYLGEIELLLYKGMPEACRKHILKAKALAREIEAWELLHKILTWERQLAVAHPEMDLPTAQIVQEINDTTAQQLQFDTALELYERATRARVEAVQTRNQQKLTGFKPILQHALFHTSPRALGIRTRIRLLQVQSMRFYAGRELEPELKHNLLVISLYDKHPLLRTAYATEYVAIHARVISLLKNLNAPGFQKALATFRAFEQPPEAVHAAVVNAQIFSQSYMVELSNHLTRGAYYAAMRLLPAIETGSKKHAAHLGDSIRLSFDFMIAYTLFSNGAYAEARKKMHVLLQEYAPTLRRDVYNFARLLDLMIHLALGNHSNIRSAYRSVAYQFKKQSKLYATENRILKYFSHPRYYTGQAQFQHLDDLEHDLLQLQRKGMEQYALGYIRFFDWIRSRRERVPMVRLTHAR